MRIPPPRGKITITTSPTFDVVIEPGRSEGRYWRNVWQFRELLYFLTWRDILVKYKQTVLGVAWALIQPLLTMVIFTFVFGRVARLPSDGVPYPILVFSGLLPWQFVSQAIGNSSSSLVSNASLVSKLYFPRIIVPISTVLTSLVDFLVAASFLGVMMVWFGLAPGWRILAIPFFLILAFMAALSVGIWLSALTVKYRDFRYIVPFVVQLGLYISPVGFSSSVVPAEWRLVYSLNPMVAVIDGFRWAIIGKPQFLYGPGLILAVSTTSLLLWTAVRYFRATEKTFADNI